MRACLSAARYPEEVRLVDGVLSNEIRHPVIGKRMHAVQDAYREKGYAEEEVLVVFGKEKGVPRYDESHDTDKDADAFGYSLDPEISLGVELEKVIR